MEKKRCKNGRKYTDPSFARQNDAWGLPQNISLSGMMCRTSRRIDEMTLLDIKFQLPQRGDREFAAEIWVECRGVVVSCERREACGFAHPYEIEIFFDHISERNRLLLAYYVQG